MITVKEDTSNTMQYKLWN